MRLALPIFLLLALLIVPLTDFNAPSQLQPIQNVSAAPTALCMVGWGASSVLCGSYPTTFVDTENDNYGQELIFRFDTGLTTNTQIASITVCPALSSNVYYFAFYNFVGVKSHIGQFGPFTINGVSCQTFPISGPSVNGTIWVGFLRQNGADPKQFSRGAPDFCRSEIVIGPSRTLYPTIYVGTPSTTCQATSWGDAIWINVGTNYDFGMAISPTAISAKRQSSASTNLTVTSLATGGSGAPTSVSISSNSSGNGSPSTNYAAQFIPSQTVTISTIALGFGSKQYTPVLQLGIYSDSITQCNAGVAHCPYVELAHTNAFSVGNLGHLSNESLTASVVLNAGSSYWIWQTSNSSADFTQYYQNTGSYWACNPGTGYYGLVPTVNTICPAGGMYNGVGARFYYVLYGTGPGSAVYVKSACNTNGLIGATCTVHGTSTYNTTATYSAVVSVSVVNATTLGVFTMSVNGTDTTGTQNVNFQITVTGFGPGYIAVVTPTAMVLTQTQMMGANFNDPRFTVNVTVTDGGPHTFTYLNAGATLYGAHPYVLGANGIGMYGPMNTTVKSGNKGYITQFIPFSTLSSATVPGVYQVLIDIIDFTTTPSITVEISASIIIGQSISLGSNGGDLFLSGPFQNQPRCGTGTSVTVNGVDYTNLQISPSGTLFSGAVGSTFTAVAHDLPGCSFSHWVINQHQTGEYNSTSSTLSFTVQQSVFTSIQIYLYYGLPSAYSLQTHSTQGYYQIEAIQNTPNSLTVTVLASGGNPSITVRCDVTSIPGATCLFNGATSFTGTASYNTLAAIIVPLGTTPGTYTGTIAGTDNGPDLIPTKTSNFVITVDTRVEWDIAKPGLCGTGTLITLDGVNYSSYDFPVISNWVPGSNHQVVINSPGGCLLYSAGTGLTVTSGGYVNQLWVAPYINTKQGLSFSGGLQYITETVSTTPIVTVSSVDVGAHTVYQLPDNPAFNLWSAVLLMMVPFVAFTFLGYEASKTSEGIGIGAALGGGIGVIINVWTGNFSVWAIFIIVILLAVAIISPSITGSRGTAEIPRPKITNVTNRISEAANEATDKVKEVVQRPKKTFEEDINDAFHET